MSFRVSLFGAVCALVFASISAPAMADGFDAVVGGDYGNIDLNHGGPTLKAWGVNGSGAFNLGSSEWKAQIDAGYRHINGGGTSADDWNVGGSAFWNDAGGRLGATVGYTSVDSGGSLNATNYGAFGDWYAGQMFTLSGKGGFFNANHGVDGDYLGAAVSAYAMPDLAFTGSYDYTHIKHFANENDLTVQAEWLVSESTPVSVYGGFERSTFSSSGGLAANTFFIGLHWYCDPAGTSTLVSRQRNGAETWGTHFGALAFNF